MFKRVFIGSIVGMALVVSTMALPALADVGVQCQSFWHNNQTQHLNACIGINHTHVSTLATNGHFTFNDSNGADVYFVTGVVMTMYTIKDGQVKQVAKGDFPVFHADTDVWLDHDCYWGTDNSPQVWVAVSFKIEWDVGDYSNTKTMVSDIKDGIVCM